MSFPFKTVAVIGKHKNPDIAVPLFHLGQYLKSRGVEVLLESLTAASISTKPHAVATLEEIGARADLAIVLGGDGTMLNIARKLAPFDVPLVGINQGRLGFLTDLSIDSMTEALGPMLDGGYVAERRMLLHVEVARNSVGIFDSLALNDVAVNRGVSGNMIELEVRIDGEYVYSLRADGLIVATPTGSTAYALSAGGPILHPGLDLVALVPVSPHTLSNRSIVVEPGAVVEILMHHTPVARVHADSHFHFDLQAHDKVMVRRSPYEATLLHAADHSYYRMLREKLGWSGLPRKPA
ncbi:NAD kinase [Nitrosovibrio sp. Nv17]|jgi:NAD+ kinase|uniref:NAD kinase n=1 Tax=Nitrosovibrio sp. Nv17 TaxID=1855339 RepID=UPI000908944B|nr:NAD kinase [Nitrosovibrio sp. Nv17]SFW19612.1 NAD+ kinase [Nitrosovibrio sp. Nv17]